VTNLPIKAEERDIREFFEKTGAKVRDVRLVRDRGSGKSKGFGYIEMDSIQGVSNAIALSGTQMMTSTITVQASQAEKNRERAAQRAKAKQAPMRLYVGNVHPNATVPDLERIFKEFGSIDSIELDRDDITLTSKGFAFIQYRDPEGAKRALVGGNGFMFAGQALKVGLVSDTTKTAKAGVLDSVNEDTDQGVQMNAQKRASLMAKLIRDDPTDESAVSLSASTCVLLKNMFDQIEASIEPNFEVEMTEDVKEEAMKFGELVHLFVDIKSDGFIYLRYSSIASAAKALAALNGRWFGGRQVSAAFFPETTYGAMFPNWRG
jgi:RNA-binding protein 39